MKLSEMFVNVLDLDFDALVAKVEKDSVVRDNALEAAGSKFDIDGTKKKVEKPKVPKMTVQEKAIMKALGLNLKDVQTLVNQAR